MSSAEDLRALVHEYLIIFVWRVPLYLMFFTWQTLIRTDGFAKVVSRGILSGQITNVILSFALVANGFGIMGASIALISGDIIAMGYVAKKYFSSSERSRKFYPVLKDFGKFINQAGRIIKAGIPIASGTALISVKVWAIYQILGETGGADAMTLYAICMACLSLVSMCIAGCNGAMMPIIGMLYGEKDFSGVRILIKYVLRFALTLSGIFVLFAIFFPQIILSIYNVPDSLIASGEIALRLFSISLIGVTITFLAMLQTEKAKYLLRTTHHVCFDRSAANVFFADVAKAYADPDTELAPESYDALDAANDETKARASESFVQAKAWYEKTFGGLDIEALPIPDCDAKEISFDVFTKTFPLDYSTLRSFCKANKISASALTSAAFALVLGTYTHQQESLFSTIYHGRDEKTKNIIGMFVKTLPVYCRWTGDEKIS